MPTSGIFNVKDVSESVIRSLQEKARESIDHHSVSFVREQATFGSGTFVQAFGAFGVLTAAHVAENLFDRSGKPCGIVITKEPAATFLGRTQVEIVSFGRPSPGADFTEYGPDLAFVSILDPEVLSTIKAKKSFVPLERGVLQGYEKAFSKELHPSPWIISGAPAVFQRHTGERGTGEHVFQAAHFTGDAEFVDVSRSGEFDLIRMKVNSGQSDFPSNYGGVSGGGLWFAPFGMDPAIGISSLEHIPPQFFGVVFYQSARDSNERELIAHGVRSIFFVALNRLKEHFA